MKSEIDFVTFYHSYFFFSFGHHNKILYSKYLSYIVHILLPMPSKDNIYWTHGVVSGTESSRSSGLYGCVCFTFLYVSLKYN